MQTLLDNFGLGFAVIAGLLLPPAIAAMLLAIEKMRQFIQLAGPLITRPARKFHVDPQWGIGAQPAPGTLPRRSMLVAHSTNLVVTIPPGRRPGLGGRWKSQNRVAC